MLIPLFKSYYDEDMGVLANKVLSSGYLAYGSYVNLFSEGLAKELGHQHLLTLDNMTNAMELALKLSGVLPGDEVLTTPFSCMASNSPIATLGAVPIWTDIIPGTVEIDLDKLEQQINEKTKAIILYHLAGYPNKSVEVFDICRKRGVKVIEDCNNAMFSSISGRNVGTYGDFSVYSFYPNRLINTVDGAGLSILSSKDYLQAKKLIKYGIDQNTFRDSLGEINPDSDIPSIWRTIGMNNLSSSLGYLQLSCISEKIRKIKENVSKLQKKLREFKEVYIVPINKESSSVNWVLLIQIDKRDEIINCLKANNIQVSKLHQLNSIYSGFNSKPVDTFNIDFFQGTVLALPCGWWIEDSDIVVIIDKIRLAIKKVNPGKWPHA